MSMINSPLSHINTEAISCLLHPSLNKNTTLHLRQFSWIFFSHIWSVLILPPSHRNRNEQTWYFDLWNPAPNKMIDGTEKPQILSEFSNVRRNTTNLAVNWGFAEFYTHLKFSPPSVTLHCSPPSSPETKLFKWLTSITVHSSSSLCLLNGSKLERILPQNNTGSYPSKNHQVIKKDATNSQYYVAIICFFLKE